MSKRPANASAPSASLDATALHDAALAYLARYAATEATLRRMLERRIDRWARAATPSIDPDSVAAAIDTARLTAAEVVSRLASVGAVSDVAFSESRTRSLIRAGRSQRAIGAHLAAKGVDAELQRQVLSRNDGDTEFAAALVLAKRRRIGPFRTGAPPDGAGRHRELAIMARAGFPQTVARRALDAALDEAETLVNQLRR